MTLIDILRFRMAYKGADRQAAKDIYFAGTEEALAMLKTASGENDPVIREIRIRGAIINLFACEALAYDYFTIHGELIGQGAIQPQPPTMSPEFGRPTTVGQELREEDTQAIWGHLRRTHPAYVNWMDGSADR